MKTQDRYRHFDTSRADGVHVTLIRETCEDDDSNPRDYLFHDDAYRAEDQARLDAWHKSEWRFVGIRVRAEIDIVCNGTGTAHTLYSAGCWGIESDSGEEYLASVVEDEMNALIADLRALGAGPFTWRGARA